MKDTLKLTRDQEVTCPSCGCDHVHINTVKVVPTNVAHDPRYKALVIGFQCESCPVDFEVVMQHSKGQIRVSTSEASTGGFTVVRDFEHDEYPSPYRRTYANN